MCSGICKHGQVAFSALAQPVAQTDEEWDGFALRRNTKMTGVTLSQSALAQPVAQSDNTCLHVLRSSSHIQALRLVSIHLGSQRHSHSRDERQPYSLGLQHGLLR